MVTFAQLKDMDTSKLAGAAATAGTLSSSMSSRASQVNSKADVPSDIWAGVDATAASTKLEPLDSPLFDVSDSANHSKATLEELSEELNTAKDDLNELIHLAEAHGLRVDSDGKVHTPPTTDFNEAQRDAEIARQIEGELRRVLALAEEADSDAISRLSKREFGGLASTGTATLPGNGFAPSVKWGVEKNQQRDHTPQSIIHTGWCT